MTDVLAVTARELCHPVLVFVLMKPRDRADDAGGHEL